MKKLFGASIFQALFISLLLFSVYSCSDDDTVNVTPGGTISGTIIFTDSVFQTTSGYYNVSAFASWPPTSAPKGTDSLVIIMDTTNNRANYSITVANNGTYYITSAWTKLPYVQGVSDYGLGLYGCDTSLCNPTGVAVADGSNVNNINFLSWADTTNRIY